MTNFLFRKGDPPHRKHHEEWSMTALIKADTASIFAVLGAGKGYFKLLKSAPLEALKEPRADKDIPDGGRSQAFRRRGSAWLQISSFRAGIHLYGNVQSISRKLDTVVYSTFDTEDGFSYQLFEKGKLIESYLRSSEDAYEWIPEEDRKKTDKVRSDGSEVLNTKRKVAFSVETGAAADLEFSLLNEYELDPVPVKWSYSRKFNVFKARKPYVLDDITELYWLDLGMEEDGA